jgi:heme-degrading monooxygenase HmoA
MWILITTSQTTPDKFRQVEDFLESFLPKLSQVPGVSAVYHYASADQSSETTLTVWESEEALRRYQAGDLVKEALALRKKMNLPGSREAYPLIYPTGRGE